MKRALVTPTGQEERAKVSGGCQSYPSGTHTLELTHPSVAHTLKSSQANHGVVRLHEARDVAMSGVKFYPANSLQFHSTVLVLFLTEPEDHSVSFWLAPRLSSHAEHPSISLVARHKFQQEMPHSREGKGRECVKVEPNLIQESGLGETPHFPNKSVKITPLSDHKTLTNERITF